MANSCISVIFFLVGTCTRGLKMSEVRAEGINFRKVFKGGFKGGVDWVGDTGGEWSLCTHLKEYGFNWSPGLGRYLTSLKPKTALEFGSGAGLHASYLAGHADTNVTCIEPSEALGKFNVKNHEQGLFGNRGMIKPLALNIFSPDSRAKQCVEDMTTQKYDLVMTFEVAEHIPAKFHGELVKFLVKSTGKWLLFSAARPDQQGTGHIPESMKSVEEWREIFEEAGLVYMPNRSFVARSSAYFTRSYDIFENLMVFKNPKESSADSEEIPVELLNYKYGGGGYSPLGCVQNRPCKWYRDHESQELMMSTSEMAGNSAIEEAEETWPLATMMMKDVEGGGCDSEANLH